MLGSLLNAKEYNSDLLHIHATIFPKILLTDTQLQKKLVDGKIKIIILHSQQDQESAEKLKQEILSLYPTIDNTPLSISLQQYNNVKDLEVATAYYELNGEINAIAHVNKIALKNRRITFSLNESYLSFGTLFSLHIGKKVSPVINISSLKRSKIILNNIIFTIVRIQ
ncbi:MAG: hypothetical protein Q9M40_08435 [Sulfurimonas sp.]|nr:hypothetical protein [Sulfurimonas sp.]